MTNWERSICVVCGAGLGFTQCEDPYCSCYSLCYNCMVQHPEYKKMSYYEIPNNRRDQIDEMRKTDRDGEPRDP